LFEEFQRAIEENIFLLLPLEQFLFVMFMTSVYIYSNGTFPLWKKSTSLECLLNIQMAGFSERAI
jgi:hypothetical protein